MNQMSNRCALMGSLVGERFVRALRTVRPRHAVHITPSESSDHIQLLSRQHSVRVSPLAATCMVSPASVANKRLTAGVSPLDATYKNTGEGGVPNFPARLSLQAGTHPSPTPYPLSPFFSYSWALSYTTALAQLFSSQSVTHSFRRDGGCTPLTASCISPLDANCHTARPTLFSFLPRYLLTSLPLGALRAPLATLSSPWLANASANTSLPISIGAKRSRALFASRRIPPFHSRATISTAGSKSAPVTVR